MNHALIILTILLRLNLHIADLLCDGIEILYANNLINFNTKIPAGICITDENHQSHKYECTSSGNDIQQLTYQQSLNCSGNPTSIESYSELLKSSNIFDYNLVCSGIPCNYGMQKIYPTTTCSDDPSTVSSLYYNADPIIIGSCHAASTSSALLISCDNNEKFNIMYYDNNTDCTANGVLINNPTISEGYCDENGYQYSIICGVAETQMIYPTTSVIPIPTETISSQYSLYGSWSIQYANNKILYGFDIQIDLNCEHITFTLISPATDTWFAIGMGGDYSYNGADTMNGYCITSLFSELDTVFESTLESGEGPAPQHRHHIDCEHTEYNGIRTVVCKRRYKTDDTEDFYKFILGENKIIWASGGIYPTGIPSKHGNDNIGGSNVDIIYMEGHIDLLCGYAKEYADGVSPDRYTETTESMPKTSMNSSPTLNTTYQYREEMDEWLIIGTIFIVLFGVAVLFLVYYGWRVYRNSKNSNDDINIYTNTDETEVAIEQTKIKSPGRRKKKDAAFSKINSEETSDLESH